MYLMVHLTTKYLNGQKKEVTYRIFLNSLNSLKWVSLILVSIIYPITCKVDFWNTSKVGLKGKHGHP